MSGRTTTLIAGLVLATTAHVLLVDRFLRALSDDVEALVHNLHLDWTTDYAQLWYANADWIAPFGGALRWGLLPPTVLLLAAAGFRGAELLGLARDPLPSLSGRWRAGLGATAGLGLALGALPLSLGLCVWTAVEAYHWVEWTGHVEPLMQDLYNVLPWFVLPGVLLLGGLALSAALAPRGSWWRDPLAFPSLWRLPGLIGGVVVAAPLLAVAFVGLFHAPRIASLPGRAVWAESCGACHERALPLYYVKTPAEWQQTVRTHRLVEKLDVDEDEAAALHGYLAGMRAVSDAWTFRARCQSCHGTGWRGWEARTAEDWGDIVRRLARWSPYFYSPGVQEQLVRFLASEKGTTDPDFGLGSAYADYVEVVEVCDPCHSVSHEAERYRDASRDATLAMVRRMNQKLPEPLEDEELATLTDVYIDLIGEPLRFDRLVPHDQPESSGGGL